MILDKTEKICLSCYRYFSYRKKWAGVWSDVKYCSEKCKKYKLKYKDHEYCVQLKLYIRAEHPKKIFTNHLSGFMGERNKNLLNTMIRKLYIDNTISVFDQKGKKVSPLLEKGPYYIALSSI
ncbi:DUF2256 domain-containing protein [bacterium]|nr:DUF2256 domain-containing protein [bacterium]